MQFSLIPRQHPRAATPPGHTSHRWRWVAPIAAATLTAGLTAAAAPGAATSTAKAATSARPGPVSCGPPGYFIQCYSPGQYQVAYGVTPLPKRGITGKGETVVMPELANAPDPISPNIRKDLAAFDKKFGLPTAELKVTTTLAGASAPYVAGATRRSRTPSSSMR
jgi:subtilase family serine protease